MTDSKHIMRTRNIVTFFNSSDDDDHDFATHGLPFKAGDRVRSYDYDHSLLDYVEGVLVGVMRRDYDDVNLECDKYVIEVDIIVEGGLKRYGRNYIAENPHLTHEQIRSILPLMCRQNGGMATVYPPLNGTPKTFDNLVCNGVENADMQPRSYLRRVYINEHGDRSYLPFDTGRK